MYFGESMFKLQYYHQTQEVSRQVHRRGRRRPLAQEEVRRQEFDDKLRLRYIPAAAIFQLEMCRRQFFNPFSFQLLNVPSLLLN